MNGFQAEIDALLEGLNDLMADLEDIRDAAQDVLDESESTENQKTVGKLDAALALLFRAAGLLEDEE